VSAIDRGYRVRVTVVTQAGVERERDVVAASCTEATEAAVAILTAGMALDDPTSFAESGADGPDSASAAASPPPAASADAGARSIDSASLTDAGDATPVHVLVGASVGVDIGTLAAVAPFAQLAGGIEWGRLSLLASAAAPHSYSADEHFDFEGAGRCGPGGQLKKRQLRYLPSRPCWGRPRDP
jgi:hypothetical protein